MQRNSVFHIPKSLPPSHLQINDHCPFLQRDDHGFSPLHWACREGRSAVVEMLIMRGARINVMNRGDDTPLHLAASHGHRDIVQKVCMIPSLSPLHPITYLPGSQSQALLTYCRKHGFLLPPRMPQHPSHLGLTVPSASFVCLAPGTSCCSTKQTSMQ